jgi:hypothetical protein
VLLSQARRLQVPVALLQNLPLPQSLLVSHSALGFVSQPCATAKAINNTPTSPASRKYELISRKSMAIASKKTLPKTVWYVTSGQPDHEKRGSGAIQTLQIIEPTSR